MLLDKTIKGEYFLQFPVCCIAEDSE